MMTIFSTFYNVFGVFLQKFQPELKIGNKSVKGDEDIIAVCFNEYLSTKGTKLVNSRE